MPTLAAVVVPVRPDLSGFPGATKAQLENAFRQVTPTVESNAKKHGHRFGNVFGSGVGETINSKLSPALAGIGDEFGAFAGASLGPLSAVGAGIGLLAGQAVNMGVRTAASMEQAQIGFETLLGSGQAAQTFLSNLEQFAAATPFELPGLVESSRTLMGVGLDAKGTMTALQAFGNASSAVGVGQENFQRIMVATSQAIGAGRFMTEDLNQITENGIPIWTILSRAMGKPVPELRKLASAGKLMTSDVLPLLEKQMNRDYGGAMVRQSRSLSGVWSTFMDTLNIGMSRVLQPLIPLMTTGLTAATNVLAGALSLIPRLFQGASGAGSGFSTVIAAVSQWLQRDLIPAFRTVAAQVMPAVHKAISDVSAAFRDHQDVIDAVGKVFQGLGLLLTRVVIPALGLVVTYVLSNLGPAIRVILTIVGAVRTAVETVARIAPQIAGAGRQVVTSLVTSLAANPVARAIVAVVRAIVDPFVTAGSWLIAHGGEIVGGLVSGITVGTLSRARNGLAAAISAVVAAIMAPFANANGMLSDQGGLIVKGLAQGMGAATPEAERQARTTSAAIQLALSAPSVSPTTIGLLYGTQYASGLTTGLIAALDVVRTFAINSVTTMAALPSRMLALGAQTTAQFAVGLRTPVRLVSAAVSAMFQAVVGPFAGAAGWLLGAGVNIVTGLVGGVTRARPQITVVLALIYRQLLGGFVGAQTWLIRSGVNVIAGLMAGVRIPLAQLLGLITGVVIRTYIRGPFAPAGGWLINQGVQILTGLMLGLRRAWGGVASSITTGISRYIRGPWGGAGGWLFNVGFNVIYGLLSGMRSAWNSVTKWVSGIAGWIRAHKGPLDLDAALLIPAGRAIMQGFLNGLQSGAGPAWSFVKSVGGKTVATLRNELMGALSSIGNITVPANVTGAKAIGRSMMSQIWPDNQWPSLYALWQGESGWNPLAHNPSSGAHGIPQSLPASKMASAGPDYMTNPATQIRWGLNYIKQVYGSPSNAYAKWLSRSPHWYDAGGWLPPGGIGMNLTGRPERVLDPQASETYARGSAAGNVRVMVMLDGSVIDDRVHVLVEDAVGELGARIDNGIGG